MSTIKVNKIENTATTAGGVAIDSSGHVTVDGLQLPSAGALSNRNLIINGAMQVAQRGTAAVSTSGAFPVDRFKTSYNVTGGAFTAQQSTDAPEGFKNSTKFEVTTAASAGAAEVSNFQYFVEGQDMQQADFGLSSAKNLTLSFWVKSSLVGTYSVSIRNQGGSRAYIAEYTVSSANTWEKKTITFPGSTDGTWATDNTTGALLAWDLGSGSDRQGTAGSWLSGTNDFASSNNVNWCNTSSATWYITGVQLEVGAKATPYEHRSYSDELVKCCRYYQKSYNQEDAVGTITDTGTVGSRMDHSTTASQHPGTVFRHTMRATPTVTLYSPNNGLADRVSDRFNSIVSHNADVVVLSIFAPGQNGFAGMTISSNVGPAITYHYTAEAEL